MQSDTSHTHKHMTDDYHYHHNFYASRLSAQGIIIMALFIYVYINIDF